MQEQTRYKQSSWIAMRNVIPRQVLANAIHNRVTWRTVARSCMLALCDFMRITCGLRTVVLCCVLALCVFMHITCVMRCKRVCERDHFSHAWASVQNAICLWYHKLNAIGSVLGVSMNHKQTKITDSIGYSFLRSPHSDVWELPKQDASFLTHADFLSSIGKRAFPVLVILIHPNADYAGKNILLSWLSRFLIKN